MSSVAAHPWAATPLGSVETWPQSLKTIVALVLGSPLAMIALWGPELIQIYNDGYASICGPKHPQALGQSTRECWPEVWEFNEPLYKAVLSGESRSFTGQELKIERTGRAEVAWFDLTYSPLADEAGGVAGVLVTVVETTARVLAERRVAAERDAQRRHFEQAPGFIAILAGQEHVYDFFNEAYAHLVGRRDLLGKTVREALPDIAGQGFYELLDGVYATSNRHVAKGVPVRMQREPGVGLEERFIDFIYEPITGHDGHVTGIFVQGHDVTDAKRAADALRASEEFSRVILASSLDCVKVLDLDGTIQFMSEGGRRVMELDDLATVVGCPWLEVWRGQTSLDASNALQIARAGGMGRFQGFAPTAKGSSRWWDVVVTPVPGADGIPNRLLSISRDITPLLEMKQALADSETKFQIMTDAMPQMVWSTRADGHHDYYNHRWYDFTGTVRGDRDPGVWRSLLHPDDLRPAVLAWRRSLTTGEPYEAEYRLRRSDGTWRWCLSRALPMRDTKGRAIQRWFGTCTDIQDLVDTREALASSREGLEQRIAERTADLSQALRDLQTQVLDREQAEAALRQSQKMEAVGQLTGGIAHDFNNLLQGISGSLEMLKARIGQRRTVEAERFVASAMAGVERAAALTHRLLAYSRKQALDPKQVDANQLVAGMEDLVRRTVGPGIQVAVVLAGGLWTTLCDAHQLENALLNLAINARDAMPDGGRLTIETANSHLDKAYARSQDNELQPGQYILVSVTDTGTGMPVTVVKKAFEPFFTTKPVGQGTGLGLSMLYGFAKQSRGHARIHSEVGQGTTVNLYLPRNLAPEMTLQPGLIGSTGVSRPESGATILLVEDEIAVRMLVVEMLQELGYHVLETHDASSALHALQAAVRVDLLITDVGLPGMNGVELAKTARIRQPNLKVLFVTGYAHNAAIGQGEALESGMALLSKPFTSMALAAKVGTMIQAQFHRTNSRRS
jgi:PAS domain S-box-containing protein